jgi:sucrose-6-phosphate hydrolase SacC (GH32 family)
MMSRDLVTWENLPDALWPELQTPEFGFDMKGIWSGDVIVDGGRAFAFYTSVNHGSRLAASNPGIAMAVSTDPQLRDWHKLGPILNTEGVKDFRDPFLWKEGNTWHMIIGAALETGGGLDYLVLNPGEKGGRWERQRRFSELSYRVMDPGSVIWEMPVFEKLSETVWILLVNPIGGKVSKYGNPATRAVYWTGEWSGGVFKPFFRDAKPLDLVPGHLAPTVERAPDGSLRAIGIIDERRTPVSQERAGWANMFGLPRVWTLMPDRRTLGQAPAPELGAMRGEPRIARKGVAIGGAPVTIDDGLRAYELQLDLGTRASQGPITIDVLASPDGRETTRLRFDPTQGSVAVDKSHSTLSDEGEGPQVLNGVYDSRTFGDMRRLRVIVDGSSIEVFINDAAAYAVRSYPSLPGATGLRIAEAGNPGATADLTLWPLRRPVR